MLISEIKPIDKVGINLLKRGNAETVIDQIIELPLRKACKIFAEKEIQTVMSSANKDNILPTGTAPTEKEDVYGNHQELQITRPSFKDAGRGYAWIMLDCDSLSDENKDYLFALEEKKNGEKAIWFVHPYEMGNIEFDLKIGKYDDEFLKQIMPVEEIPKGIEVDSRLVEFEKRHIVLGYGEAYPLQSVFLRMPVNGQTTVEQVENYFVNFAKTFKSQIKVKQMDSQGEFGEK